MSLKSIVKSAIQSAEAIIQLDAKLAADGEKWNELCEKVRGLLALIRPFASFTKAKLDTCDLAPTISKSNRILFSINKFVLSIPSVIAKGNEESLCGTIWTFMNKIDAVTDDVIALNARLIAHHERKIAKKDLEDLNESHAEDMSNTTDSLANAPKRPRVATDKSEDADSASAQQQEDKVEER